MLGLGKSEVKLVPHNEKWAELFQQEKKLLNSLIGEFVLGIEHIGSTAIQGIYAKPIIDIVIGVRSLNDFEKFNMKAMNEQGYYHLGRVEIEGKVVCAKFSDLENLIRTHYLHIVEYEGDWWNKHLLFRDRLNDSHELAQQYEALKRSQAEQFGDNVLAYTEAKEAFIERVLDGK